MENSYRGIWELDVDAPDAKEAAKFAHAAIISGAAPAFEVHQWREPEMIHIDPVAIIDVSDLSADLPVPDRRTITEQYFGPDII